MGVFLLITAGTMLVVGILSTYLKKYKQNSKIYLLPGSILTAIAFIIAIVTWFTSSNGWTIMGNSFLFFFVFIGAAIGTFVGRTVAAS